MRTPDVIENLSMRAKCDGSEIASGNTGFLVREKMIEHVSARLRAQRDGYAFPSPIVRKFFREAKRTGLDLCPDSYEMCACSAQVCFGGKPFQCWAEADSVHPKVEEDAVATNGRYAASD